jgi:hypothetical protein
MGCEYQADVACWAKNLLKNHVLYSYSIQLFYTTGAIVFTIRAVKSYSVKS